MTYKEAHERRLLAFEFPKTIRIDPINQCDNNCSFCGKVYVDHSALEQISVFAVEKIAYEFRAYEPFRVIIGFNNEPLLHKEILTIVKTLRRSNKHLSICMITNGNALTKDERLLPALFEAGLNIIHIDVYDTDNQMFWRAHIKNPLKGVVYADFYKDNAIYTSKGGSTKKILFCNAIDFRKEKSFVRNWHTYGGSIPYEKWLSGKLADYPMKKTCVEPLKSLNITANGDVIVCCRDMSKSVVLGNIVASSLKEIWESERNKYCQFVLKNGMREKVPCCYFCSIKSERAGLYPFIGNIFHKALNLEPTKEIQHNLNARRSLNENMS